ncbi:hypothetical protein SGRIM128S_06437 [Streptomyces griseomycini]
MAPGSAEPLRSGHAHSNRRRLPPDRPFAGNPAGVLLLDSFPDDPWLQNVALEVNHAETAFAHPLPEGGEADWALRWFTPTTEVAMCGHATLATAHVLHTTGAHKGPGRFATLSGVLIATPGEDGAVTLDFPTAPLTAVDVPEGVAEALGARPRTAFDTGPNTGDLLVEVADERTVHALRPDLRALAAHSERGVIATARAENPALGYDFVSRCFFPNVGIDEDPVTGSATACPTGPSVSAAPSSPASRPRRAPAVSARRCAASAPAERAGRDGRRGRSAGLNPVRQGRARPHAPFPVPHAVGSQSTLPASSAYPTNAPMSSSVWAATSGPTRPQRRDRYTNTTPMTMFPTKPPMPW